MRVLLDTNALAGSIVGFHLGWLTPPAQLWRLWLQERFDLLISEQVMSELATTLSLPWFAARIDQSDRDAAVTRLYAEAKMVLPSKLVVGIAGHWQDDLALAAAVSGHADYLVTGDAKFRRVGEYGGVKLRTPAEFLTELDAQSHRVRLGLSLPDRSAPAPCSSSVPFPVRPAA